MTKHLSPDERTKQIIEAARTCFLDKGYFNTKMDDIARAASLSKGGVYFHFDSKREIFRALVSFDYESLSSILTEAVDSEGTLRERMLMLSKSFFTALSQGNRARMMVIVSEMSMRDEEVRQEMILASRSYVEQTTNLLKKGIQQGALRQDIDVEAVAFLLKTIVDGFQANAMIGHTIPIERFSEVTISLILDGIEA